MIDNIGGGGGGPEKGVFVTFAAPGSNNNKAIQKVNLTLTKAPKVTFEAGINEASFLEIVGATTYDYVADPLLLGQTNSPADYKFTVETDEAGNIVYNFEYTLSSKPVEPTWGGYDFIAWVVDSIKAPAGVTFTGIAVGNTVNLETFKIISSAQLARSTAAVASIKANITENEQIQTSASNLQNTVNELLHSAENGALYSDDYVIGEGGADTEAFQAALNRAAEILAGTTHTLTTALDGEFYVSADNKYLDNDGITELVDNGDGTWTGASGHVYNSSELPLPVMVTMEYTLKNTDEMDAQTATLAEMAQNIDFAAFLPNQLTFAYNEPVAGQTSNYYSLTVNKSGLYEIDLYGASGGHVYTRAAKTALGGLGGHVKGTVHLEAGSMLKIFVGAEGQGSGVRDGDTIVHRVGNVLYPASFPDGGSGNKSKDGNGNFGGSAESCSSSGGGSTSIRLVSTIYDAAKSRNGMGDAAAVYTATTSNDSRLAVAGGGGGASQGGWTSITSTSGFWPGLRGGNAGPATLDESTDTLRVIVQNGVRTYANHAFETPIDNGTTLYYKVPRESNSSVFVYYGTSEGGRAEGGKTANGLGENGRWPNDNKYEASGGGGGGYKGGGSANNAPSSLAWIASGGGGSNWAGSSVNVAVNSTNSLFGNGSLTIKFIQ
jgi:hypothetical protein